MIYSVSDIRIKCKFKYEKMQVRANRFLEDLDNEFEYTFEITQQEIVERMMKYPHLPNDQNEVVSSAQLFYEKAKEYNRMLLHAVTIVVDNKAYLFFAPPSGGKTTMAANWKKVLGERAIIIADDSPIIEMTTKGIRVWNSCWSKCTEEKTSRGYSLNGIGLISKSNSNSVYWIPSEQAILEIAQMYPKDEKKLVAECLLNFMSDVKCWNCCCDSSIEATMLIIERMVGKPDEKKYDYLIVGGGVAGNVCAYELQKKGYSCLIFEKSQTRLEKICGGGIPYKALEKLEIMGMDLDILFHKDVSRINGDVIFGDRQTEETIYDKQALGCRRADFDDFLLYEALKEGAEICWGMPVNNVMEVGSGYQIYDYYAKKVVIAAGARGILNRYSKGQSVGISAQIEGKSALNCDRFTYYYLSESGDRYFWIFPVGRYIWNVGLWFRVPDQTMKKTFNECWNKYINSIFSSYEIIRNPQAEFCGNVKLEEGLIYDAIGDYAGTNNILNGGGIYRAIKSALKYADTQNLKERKE